MKIAKIIIIFLVEIVCLGLVLFLPGRATIASLLGVLTINGLNLMTNHFISVNKIHNITNCVVLVFVALLAIFLIILLSCTHIISNSSLQQYWIVWEDDLVLVGGTCFSYLKFMIAAIVIGCSLQFANFIKSMTIALRTPMTWHEAAKCV